MTNAELIQTIRAEIERLKKEELTRNSIGVITGSAFFVSANELLSFLSTLESEKQLGLEEEIKRYYDDMDGDCRYAQTARHFAQWGAEHLKK